MKIHIAHQISQSPAGGGNQFLAALTSELKSRGIFSDSLINSDVAIINSFALNQPRLLRDLVEAKEKNSKLAVVHRIDGPFTAVRGFDDPSDDALNRLNALVADGTVFQTGWSEKETLARGLTKTLLSTTITNAPSGLLFFDDGRKRLGGRKTQIIAASWSANPNKGFQTYKWMDENLDWNRFEMNFFGNSPVDFRNIKVNEPLGSAALGLAMRSHDIFVSAARNEPCSNVLIEALHCGLPSIGFQGGGTPEILQSGGELFNKDEEIPELLEKVVISYSRYRASIDRPSLETVAESYIQFCETVFESSVRKNPSLMSALGFELVYHSPVFRFRRQASRAIQRDKRSKPNL